MEFKSTLPPISFPGARQVTDVTDKMKGSMEAFHALRFGEKFAFEKYGRGSISYLFALANIEHLKFRQLSTQEKRAWVKANSDNLIRSLPGWNSMTLRKKAERILFRQVRAFGTKHGGPFASVLGRNYVEEKRAIEWRAEITCHFDSMLPPDAPPKPRADEQVPQVQRLLTQEHPQPSGVSKKAHSYVLPELIKKHEERVYVLGITQPWSSAYRKAVVLLELMWFLSLEVVERQVWMNKYSIPMVSRSVAWASKSEVERAKIIILLRVKDLESKFGIPRIVPTIRKPAHRLFSIGKEDDAANADA